MSTHVNAAERLRNAYRSGPIAPLRDVVAPTDFQGAYEIQAINNRYWQTQGRKIVGRKIGLTSATVQKQLGVDQPDFGILYDDMAIADGGSLNPREVLQARAEVEVAVVLARDVYLPEATRDQLTAAIDYVVPAIEIVDSRIANWQITFADTVADNGSSAYFVLGSPRRPLDGLDLYTCGMALEVNAAVASVGAGAACLGHPLNAAAWLARTLYTAGDRLRAGDVLLTGALGPMVTLRPGDQVTARIGGLGCVSFAFQE